MVQKMNRFRMLISLSLMLVLLMMPCMAFAKEVKCDVTLPVKVEVTGKDAPADVEFKVIMTGEDKDTPIPAVTEGTVKGAGEISFGPVSYTLPEDYHYIVVQKKGNAENWTYDETKYLVTVRIVNDEDGGLKSEVWAVKEGSEEKCENIVFVNTYKAPEIPKETPQTGDSTNITFFAGLMMASMLVMAVIVWINYRKSRQYE